MAYIYTQIGIDGSAVNITAGATYRWGSDVLVLAQVTQEISATKANMMDTSMFVVTSGVIDPAIENLPFYVQSGTADDTPPPPPPPPTDGETPPPTPPTGSETTVTLTSKTIEGFTKAFTLIQEGRTRQLSAEQLLLLVKSAAEAKASINDADLSSTSTALSAAKVNDLIVAAKAAVVNQIYGSGVAPESLDQIVEIAQKLTDNDTEFGAFLNTLAGKLSFNEAQSLTTEQKTTARTNIDAASNGDVTAAITAAVGDPSTIDIDALAASIVTPFPAALPTA